MAGEELTNIGESQLVGDMNRIQSSGRHLLSLIDDILDISRIEAGKMELEISEFHVVEMIRETEEVIRPMVEKNNSKLIVKVNGQVGVMCSDMVKVRQILYNLLSNASKFTHEGEVKLEVSKCELSVFSAIDFVVTDTGIGMTDEQQSNLFEKFFQGESGINSHYQGTGLGLAITKHFSEMMDGEIEVKSTRGVGTSFKVTLPVEVRV